MPVYEYKGVHYDLSTTDPVEAKNKIKAHLGETTEAPKRYTSADIPDDKGNIVVPPNEKPEPSLSEKAGAAIEAAGGALSGMATSLVAMPYGVAKDIYKRVTGETEAGKSNAEEYAGKVMEKAPLQPKTELGQEYLGKVGEVMQNVPAFIPEVSGISTAGMGAKLSSMLEQRRAFKAASATEKPSIIEAVAKEHPEYTSEQINHFLEAPEDVHINAQKKAQALIDKGASTKEVESTIEKHPLVGQYIKDYEERYKTLQEATGTPERSPTNVETTYPNGQEKTTTDVSGGIQEPTQFSTREEAVAQNAQDFQGNPIPKEIAAKEPDIQAVESVVNNPNFKGANLADVAFGSLNTRLHNVSPEIGRRAMDVEMAIKKDTHQSIAGADKALSYLEKDYPNQFKRITGQGEEGMKAFEDVKNKWLNGDREGLKQYVKDSGNPEVITAFDNMIGTINKVGKELNNRGLAEYRESYLPRIVKDREGLLNSMGLELKSHLEKALQKEASSQGVSVKQLDDVSYSNVVNKYMRKAVVTGTGKAGLTKGRVFEQVSPEMQKFYYDPVETYHTYMERAWNEIHTSDFFGKNKVLKDGKIDVDASIGNYLNEQVAQGKIDRPGSPKWDEVAKVLETRYKYGHLVPNESIQNLNNVSTVFTIANGLSALSNLSDLASASFFYGLKPAMQAMAQTLTGKRLFTVKDFGFTDHISEEFIGSSATQNLANNAMKASLWKLLDPLGKNIQFNSSLNRGFNWAAGGEKGIKKLTERYGEAYGKDFPQLVKDLQEKKDTPLTRSMVLWDVAQHQPLTKLQKSEMQTKYPNSGGMALKLKSFMMAQADFARRNAYNEIKAGNYQKGFKNLMIIAGAWAAVGASQKAIKNFILGDDSEIKATDIVAGALGQVGYNQYAMDTLAQGKPAQALGMMAAPPFVSALGSGWTKQKNGQTVLDERGIARKIPIIGSFIAGKMKQEQDSQNKMKKEFK